MYIGIKSSRDVYISKGLTMGNTYAIFTSNKVL